MSENVSEPEDDEEDIIEEGEEVDQKFNPLDGYKGETITRILKAIRQKCLRCSGDSSTEVKHCNVPKCELYPFRTGKNPYRRKREMTDEQREKISNRMKKMVAGRISKDKQKNPYGYCPICKAPGKLRERRPDGDDTCRNGHTYKSSTALDSSK